MREDITPPSAAPPESVDLERIEIPWEAREEDYLTDIRGRCDSLSERHGAKAAKFRRLYNALGLPAALIPTSLGAMNGVLTPDAWVISLAMVLTGILTTTSQFLNLGKKASRHTEYSGLYADLSAQITRELALPKRGRTACDVYMERVSSRYAFLQGSAPDL